MTIAEPTDADAQRLRDCFPLLCRHPGYTYLDSGATSLTPREVIDAINEYYLEYGANANRSGYRRALAVTDRIEDVRRRTARFLGGVDPTEVVFTRNATDSLNRVMHSLVWSGTLGPGKRLLLSKMEHHSNYLPWLLTQKFGVEIDYLPLRSPEGMIEIASLDDVLRRGGYSAMCISHVSNVTGNIVDLVPIRELSERAGTLLIVDGTQAAPHIPVALDRLRPDFYAFSAHKMLGPPGLGILYCAKRSRQHLAPTVLGGGSVQSVNGCAFEPLAPPHVYEAGTPNTPAIFGFGAALEFLNQHSPERWRRRELSLLRTCEGRLREIPGVTTFGVPDLSQRIGTVAFTVGNMDCDEVATLLETRYDIAIRAGLHCAQPLVETLNPAGVCRASFYLYNTEAEVLRFTDAIREISDAFA